MPLNKLDKFIKNTEGRILYVSPADLDSTDSIDNQGNSLARPFKTVQRALIEAARFSYFKGCLLYTSPSPRDRLLSRMPSSA